MRMGGTASSLRVGVRHHSAGVLSRRQDEKAWSRAADGLNLSGDSLEILDCGIGLPLSAVSHRAPCKTRRGGGACASPPYRSLLTRVLNNRAVAVLTRTGSRWGGSPQRC